MPHLVLHISPELQDQNWQGFFAKAHSFLANYATTVDSCKSRINVISHVYIGTGDKHNGLVYLELALRPRPEAMLKEIGDTIYSYLKTHVAAVLKEKSIKAEPTMEIRILSHYWQ